MPLEIKDLVSATLSSTALLVSMVTFALNYRHTRRSAVLARKPVLIFAYDGDHGWVLRNVGAGPALNIIVAQKRVGGEWFNPVRVPPLSKDGKVVLGWLNHVNTTGLGALYADTEQLAYTSTCGNDLSQVFSGTLFGPWPEVEIGRNWNHPPYDELTGREHG
jgi:hypothetical protein